MRNPTGAACLTRGRPAQVAPEPLFSPAPPVVLGFEAALPDVPFPSDDGEAVAWAGVPPCSPETVSLLPAALDAFGLLAPDVAPLFRESVL